MSAPAEESAQLVGRCYTKARRHPSVVGKVPGGGHLWGGPYTIVQLVTGLVVFLFLVVTQGLWGRFGLVNYGLLIGMPYAAAFAVRRVHVDGRSPFAVAGSLLGMWTAPSAGRMRGRAVRPARPRRLHGGAVTVGQEAALPAGPGQLVPASGQEVGDAAPPERRVASGVQALLDRGRAGAR